MTRTAIAFITTNGPSAVWYYGSLSVRDVSNGPGLVLLALSLNSCDSSCSVKLKIMLRV